MKPFNKKAGISAVVGAGIGVVMLVIGVVIVGNVENTTTWSQTLSGTIGDYLDTKPVMI